MPVTKKTTTKRTYKPRAKFARKPKMTLEKKIKAITLKEQETKLKVFPIFDNQAVLAVGLNNAGTKGLLLKNILGPTTFSMSQGTNQQERIGNSINNCQLNLRGFLHSMPTHASTNVSNYPFEVHVIVYKTKQGSSGDPDSILNNTNNTNVNIIGNASSTLLPWNRKGYIIKNHKTFRLKANPISAISTIPNVVGIENPTFNGPQASFFRRFNFNVNIAKALTFDDTGTSPMNEWCSVGVYVINGDGSTLLGTQQRAKITISATLKYKDS